VQLHRCHRRWNKYFAARFQSDVNPSIPSNFASGKARSEQKSSLLKLVTLATVALGLFAAARLLLVDQWLKAFNEWVSHFGPWGIVIFIGAYVLATVLLMPGSILTVGAGFVFGLGWGLFAVSIGSTLGAALAFLIARFVAREKIEAMARENENFRHIDKAIGAQGAKLILFTPPQSAHSFQS
jgi:uncharacterized membrane protein YdjX (TVP38/TMEM64 family)